MRGVTESMAGRPAVFHWMPLSLGESSKGWLFGGGFPEVKYRVSRVVIHRRVRGTTFSAIAEGMTALPVDQLAAALSREGIGGRRPNSEVQEFGLRPPIRYFQLRTTVIGEADAPAVRVLIRNRCPSGDAEYSDPGRVANSATGSSVDLPVRPQRDRNRHQAVVQSEIKNLFSIASPLWEHATVG